MGHDRAGVDAGDGGDALARAPLAQRFHGRPVAVLLGYIGDDNPGSLEVGGFEVLEEAELVASFRGWHAVVADERLGEAEDLTQVLVRYWI